MRIRTEISPLEFTVALIFGGLVISMVALGVAPIWPAVMIVVAAVEAHVLIELRRPGVGDSPAGRSLHAAALLTILAAALFLIPAMLVDNVKSCWECDSYTDGGGHNFFGEFALMWMVGLAALIGALVSWSISLVRLYGRAGVTRS
jgi:phosphatidylglycerophosphate synthase